MAKYSYITDKTHNNRKIQVESAKRDGSGKNFENNYAKQNGNYQSLTAGLSNNFDTKKVMVDESAFNYRKTASMGSVELEVGSPCKVKKIIGGSVAFNQLVNALVGDSEVNGVTFAKTQDGRGWVLNGTATAEIATSSVGKQLNAGIYVPRRSHKVLVSLNLDAPKSGFYFGIQGYAITRTKDFIFTQNDATDWVGGISCHILEGTSFTNFVIYPNIIDLTQMFGSTIADYIYSLEQANAGSGVAWFKRYFPKEYYAYNSGELVSVKTQGKKITHFNQWDEEWEVGWLDGTGATSQTYTDRIRSKNFIRVLSDTKYYYVEGTSSNVRRICFYDTNQNFISYLDYADSPFTTPTNCYYLKFATGGDYGATYKHDICINFHYDGERDGEYEPYNSETYPCDDVELRGIPQLDENNNLVFDGDEYSNDGNVTRKYGIVDLGTLTWTRISQDPEYDGFFNAQVGNIKANTNNVMCKLFEGGYSDYAYASMPNMTIRVEADGVSFTIKDTDYTDANAFKTAMSGVYLVYELETPTDENSIPFTEVQECDNWGTEEWLAPTTDTRPCEVPVGHETDYLPDLKAKLEVAPTTPNENGVYVMEHNASGNSYTPLATWLSDNGYAKADTLPTKDSVGGTLRQLLSVKETLDFDNTDYVDLGTLTWYVMPDNGFFAQSIAWANGTHLLTTKYKSSNAETQGTCYISNGNLLIYDNSYNNDPTAFKNAMKGVLLAYEKAS